MSSRSDATASPDAGEPSSSEAAAVGLPANDDAVDSEAHATGDAEQAGDAEHGR